MMQSELYQSVLNKLSKIPVEYLQEVDKFLAKLRSKSEPNPKKEKNDTYQKTMALAGSWSDMSDEDFDGLMKDIKESRKDWFNREIENRLE